MSSNNPYEGQPDPYGQGGQGGQPPGQPGPPPSYGYGQPPTQPPGQSEYAFGPFSPQPGPSGAPPGYVPGPAPEPGGPPRRGKGLIILGVLALVLILIGVTAAVLVFNRPIAQPQPQPQPTQSQAPTQTSSAPTATDPTTGAPPAGTLASDAVSGYLSALAAGDAATALSFSAEPVDAGPYMTNAVLAASIKRTPLTAIEVPEVTDQQASTVSASYRLGRTSVTASYDVVKVAGAWKLAAVKKTLDLGLVRSPSIPMKINGVLVTSDFVDLLPGSYAFTTASPNLTYGSKNLVVIKDPNDYANVLSLRIGLSPAGRKAVVALARRSYDGCLRARVTRPRHCPFAWTNSAYRFRQNVVWRQLGSNPFAKPRVQLVGRSARVSIPLRIRISGSCTVTGRGSGTCTGNVTGTAVASIRLDRSKLTVVWLV